VVKILVSAGKETFMTTNFNVSSRNLSSQATVFAGSVCLQDRLKLVVVDSLPPNTITRAVNWMTALGKIIEVGGYWWHNPLINIIDSEIIFEWWHDAKKMTIYSSDTSIEYIKVWGADMDHEMEEGMAETTDQIESLWQWLAS
jgi:hypothetical protein